MINLIILFPKIEEARSIRNLLVRNGIEVTSVCTTGAQAILAMDGFKSGIVVCGYRYSDMMYSELKEYMAEHYDMILILSNMYSIECVSDDIIYLTMPIKAQELISAVNEALDNQWRLKKEQKEKKKLRDSEEKEIIGKAKEVLMTQKNITEDEAHRYIQKVSMDTGTGMVETAKKILFVY